MLATHPAHQSGEPRPVLFGYRGEFKTQASVRGQVLNHGLGADLSFSYQKIDLHWSTDDPTPPREEKQSSEAQVAHWRNVFTPIAILANPNVLQSRQ